MNPSRSPPFSNLFSAKPHFALKASLDEVWRQQGTWVYPCGAGMKGQGRGWAVVSMCLMGPHEEHHSYRHRTDAVFIRAQLSKMKVRPLPQDSITGDITGNSHTHLGPRTFPPYEETLCMTDGHTLHLNPSIPSKGRAPWPHAMHWSWAVIWPVPGGTSCSPDSPLLIKLCQEALWCILMSEHCEDGIPMFLLVYTSFG